jgi:predicted alpha/beta-hydrolase family hydrolase
VLRPGTVLLSSVLLCLAARAAAQEIVTLRTRGNATQSFFIADMGGRKPEAAALLFVGGEGTVNLRVENGQIRFGARNFLLRARGEFIRNGILPVILDAPSDHKAGEGMSDEFRRSAEHAFDMRVVIAEVNKRHPGLPVFLVGTSRGTLSVANLAAVLDAEVAGAVFTSALFYDRAGKRRQPQLLGFNWAALKVPVLLVHHVDDACGATPYDAAVRLSRRYAFPLVTVKGGKPPESGFCEPLAAHGFFGREAETVDAIAGWMLGKPYAKELQ